MNKGTRLKTIQAFRSTLGPNHRIPPTALVVEDKIPGRGLYTESARSERLQYLRDRTGIEMTDMDRCSLNAEQLKGNIENMIGSVEMPVGVAGPLLINGLSANGEYFLPMATSEGALVASTARGANLLSMSGGVSARVLRRQMTRVPLFLMKDMQAAILFADSVRSMVDQLQRSIAEVSGHARLVQVEPLVLGNQVHVRFVYETGDAAGQNMTTAATWHACHWLMDYMKKYRGINIEDFWIEANMSGDKKVNFQSFIAGRGSRVSAEAFIPREVLRRIMKVTPEQIVSCHHIGMLGACQSGMVGYNINVANVIAAVFAASGQDIASVHESSVAQLHVQSVNDGLYASMLLPSLVVGTVGGGTALPRQQQLLELMDCAGPGKAGRLAEIIASYCLALDLSTMSAIVSGQFASAHERLGRNRPVDWFRADEIDSDFIAGGLADYFDDPGLKVNEVEADESFSMSGSIITELTARKVDKYVGISSLSANYDSPRHNQVDVTLDLVFKVKPLDREVMHLANSLAGMCSPDLHRAHDRWKHRTGAAACHLRELAVYEQDDPRLRRITPIVYQTYSEPEREIFLVALEKLDNVILKDTVDDVGCWQTDHIDAAIEGIARMHSIWYGQSHRLLDQAWIGFAPSCQSMVEMSDLWEQLEIHAADEFPEWIAGRDLRLHRKLVNSVDQWWAEIDAMPKTLIHNDFNPRNICLRESTDADDSFGFRLCAYDWELATVHIPQHDLAELLCFVLTPDAPREVVDRHVETHRRILEASCGQSIDPRQWRRGYYLSLCDIAINRLMLYLMAHTFLHYGYIERVSRTLRHLIRMELSANVRSRS